MKKEYIKPNTRSIHLEGNGNLLSDSIPMGGLTDGYDVKEQNSFEEGSCSSKNDNIWDEAW